MERESMDKKTPQENLRILTELATRQNELLCRIDQHINGIRTLLIIFWIAVPLVCVFLAYANLRTL